ncbi:serine/arginine-rich splicing factor SR45a-like isoform X3 [Prunus yedoensis var. nudiflora]|uniref:Serine/arginine-rich splicing factor SR45a-like isoform X3 n=1 Tax=Prunus yedoensis var. nudiflora TaxID=2094558 RepID=A0A314XRP3_PRUYE|nr:serine/arginine-rich splicing factor SR45a-like isoform X3 [Prunus yedoensis var. nudiflora]
MNQSVALFNSQIPNFKFAFFCALSISNREPVPRSRHRVSYTERERLIFSFESESDFLLPSIAKMSYSRRSRSPSVENPGNNLYVTGLSPRITKRELEKHFASEGKVIDVHLVVDPWTRESRGFGFVTMENVDEADRCIKYLDRSVLEGRVITVERARRRRGRTPTPGRYLGLRTIRVRRRTPSYSPPRRSPTYSPYRRSCSQSPHSSDRSRSRSYSPHYRSRRSYSPDYSRHRYYSRSRTPHSRSPVRQHALGYSPYDSREYSPDDSYYGRRHRYREYSPDDSYYGRRHRYRSVSPSVSPRARRRSRSYSPSISPRPRRSYKRSYSPSVSPRPRRTSRRSYSPYPRSPSPRPRRSSRSIYSPSVSPEPKKKRSGKSYSRSVSPRRRSSRSYREASRRSYLRHRSPSLHAVLLVVLSEFVLSKFCFVLSELMLSKFSEFCLEVLFQLKVVASTSTKLLYIFVHFIVSFLIIHFALACRSPQRSDVDNPMNNLHLLTSSPISLVRYSSDLSRSMSYSPHYSCRRASPYYTRRRASLYYSWQPKTYCAQCNRYRPYSYSRSPVRHRYLAYSPYDSGEFSPDDSYHVRRYRRGRRSPSPLRARRRSRRNYSHSVSPRPRRNYRRNYP